MAEGLLGERQPLISKLGDAEGHFTELDPRFHALWRISTKRQFHPDVLRELPDGDLVFLAGQSAQTYPQPQGGMDANKVDCNARRAQAELARRGGRRAWGQAILTALIGVVLGALLTFGVGLVDGDGDSSPSGTTTTTASP